MGFCVDCNYIRQDWQVINGERDLARYCDLYDCFKQPFGFCDLWKKKTW